MHKIVVTGPESTGKTTLAQALATHYQTNWVPEYARTYLEERQGIYEEHDLLAIAKGQIELEEKIASKTNHILFCDTNMLVMKVWSEFKYGRCHPFILKQLTQRNYDLYLLCGTDIDWEEDPLREHPERRDELYQIYQKELTALRFPFLELNGNLSKRCQLAVKMIDQLLVRD